MAQREAPHVDVRMLGEFHIKVDGATVSGALQHSKKLRGVAQYLLLHCDRPVTHAELYETFWPDEKSANPRAALKTLIHRLRAALVQGGAPESVPFFIVRQGSYQWNPELDTEIDAVQFERCFAELQKAEQTGNARIEPLYRAIDLYQGRFLGESELWMAAPAAYLQTCYMTMVRELCELLEAEDRFDEIAAVCRKALQFDGLDEQLNYAHIRALAAAGRQQEAMQQYQRVTEQFYDQLGVQVSDELRSLYRKIAEAEQAMDYDIDSVREKLEEGGDHENEGAYYCEFGIFQDIYHIEERSLARYGGRMFLGMLTVTDAYCQMPEQRVLSRAMEQLLGIARNSLRKCDVIARYSPAQYILLLPTVTYETGQMVLDRIRKSFRRAFPKSPVLVTGKLRPLRPSEPVASTEQPDDAEKA